MPIRIQQKSLGQRAARVPVRHSVEVATSTSIWKRELYLSPTWNAKRKVSLYDELATLLGAGLALHPALSLVSEELPERQQKQVKRALKAFSGGQDFAQAISLAEVGKFDASLLAVGEETGRLEDMLLALVEHHTRSAAYRSKLIKSLSYPGFVLVFALAVLYFMLAFLVPMFSETYARFGNDLPALTLAVQQLANLATSWTPSLAAVGTLLGTLLYRQRHSLWYRKASAQVAFRVPIFGPITHRLSLASISRTLSLLLNSGITMQRALEMTANTAKWHPIEYALEDAERQLLQGNPIWKTLKAHAIIPDRMAVLLRVGEESGHLSNAFSNLANAYDSEVDARMSLVGNLLEPILILVIGGVVGFVLVAMYLPLFSMGSQF